ncbi:MAG: hypothetical protein II058_01160, partial [Rhodocyclaceae bacterium]|nr:hypothetical protein [Rhodocyclaceae bacterium]
MLRAAAPQVAPTFAIATENTVMVDIISGNNTPFTLQIFSTPTLRIANIPVGIARKNTLLINFPVTM